MLDLLILSDTTQQQGFLSSNVKKYVTIFRKFNVTLMLLHSLFTCTSSSQVKVLSRLTPKILCVFEQTADLCPEL